MSRLSFGWEKFENVKEQPSVLILACADSSLCAQTCSQVRSLDSCVHKSILAFVYLFFSLCIHKIFSAYAWWILHTHGLSCVCIVPSKNPNLNLWAPFSHIFHLFAILTSSFTIFSLNCMSHVTFHPIMYPISLSHHSLHLIMNLISFPFFSPIFW